MNQFGTMQILAESLLDGFVKNKDILCSGNVGIGTGEGIDGKFKYVDTRSAFKSKKSYPGLEEFAKNQVNFSKNNVEGYMIGYYTPALYQGIGVPNYHQRFISKFLDFGGHVTNSKILSADISIQFFSRINIELPISNNDYKNDNLNNIDNLKEIIISTNF